jgi:tRNA pseudouridine38-40 synthase
MMGARISVVGSGRTDAGVHALRQVAHANVTRDIPAVSILMGLNSDLPGDVRVLECEETSETFHAQRSATGKTYRYTILNAPQPTALDRYRVWHSPAERDRKDISVHYPERATADSAGQIQGLAHPAAARS